MSTSTSTTVACPEGRTIFSRWAHKERGKTPFSVTPGTWVYLENYANNFNQTCRLKGRLLYLFHNPQGRAEGEGLAG